MNSNLPAYSLDEDIKGLLRVIAGWCPDCMRSNHGHCEECEATRAKRLLKSIAEREAMAGRTNISIRCDAAALRQRVLQIMKKSRRSVSSNEINLSNRCTRAMKYWVLRQLVKNGQIEMNFDGEKYLFSLNKKTQKENPTNGSNKQSERKDPLSEAAADHVGG